MIGRKMTAATSMINSVAWLDEASQTVRLLRGSSEDGSMKGNMLTPAVATTPKTESRWRGSADPVAARGEAERQHCGRRTTRAGVPPSVQGIAP